ncbi:MAG: hypothetical protein FWD88_07440 [Treponema sp.]|nr:hypothetical protein [Treponema sp.]
MTRRITAFAIAVFMSAGLAHAVDLELAGRFETGVFWDSLTNRGRMHHNDDSAGSNNRGLFRVDMNLISGNLGMRARLEHNLWAGTRPLQLDFAYGYGSLLDDRVLLSIGLLGSSPWSAGGPTIWQRLDRTMGIRTEIMPRAVPGLNFGFVLNDWNGMQYFGEFGIEQRDTLLALLQETVFGVAYTNEHFHGRFSWRLDSDADVDNHMQEGMEMMYRLEARFLGNIVEHLSVWANGWWAGIGAYDPSMQTYRNWLYIEYTPPAFSAELRVGAQFEGVRSHLLTIRPSFYYNILPSLHIGAAVRYVHNFGEEARITSFHTLEFEPEIRFRFGDQSYIALVYGLVHNHNIAGDLSRRHWINLRTTIAF